MSDHTVHFHAPAPGLPELPAAAELTAEQLRFQVASTVNFRTTEELSVSHEFVGQKRARATPAP